MVAEKIPWNTKTIETVTKTTKVHLSKNKDKYEKSYLSFIIDKKWDIETFELKTHLTPKEK